jgi:biotin synthase
MKDAAIFPSLPREGLGVGSAKGGRNPDAARGSQSSPTHPQPLPCPEGRNDWTREEIRALFDKPFLDLLFEAQQVHRRYHAPNEVQLSTLLSIKTGGCPEDCGYCSQSAHAKTGLKAEKLMDVDSVLAAAAEAKANGSGRFCMGAAWREPKDRDMDALCAMVAGVKAMGLETCMTLGMLTREQAGQLAEAGLDYYNHNLDTSPEHYGAVITTRTYEERLDTLEHVRASGMAVCCGGIVGMGESREDRVGFLHALATLPAHPESVPINALVPVKGTVLGDMLAGTPLAKIDDIEFVRTVAVARILMPHSMVRLSAGRESMSAATQALCFLAGANSMFTGDKLLTTGNAGAGADAALFEKLGLRPMATEEPAKVAAE